MTTEKWEMVYLTITYQMKRSTPEEQGISPASVLNFVSAIEEAKLELHSLILIRHGYVVAEGWWAPYSGDRPHMLFSLSKSFTSTAIGFAEQEGIVSVDDKVVSFFPEYKELYASNDHLTKMRVRHLLSMATGHAQDTLGRITESEEWVKSFLSLSVEYEPGTHFVYNSGATYMLSAILQRVTGQTLLEFLKPRLFDPLGIRNASWETCPKGISTGGWGLSIVTEDIAKFGMLYLQKGLWEGNRLLSEEWVEEATSAQVSNGNDVNSDWTQGYGFQFWRCRNGAYRGDGAFGQYCIVMPEQDAVIAITSGVDDMQAVLNVIWEHLLPAMDNNALPHDDAVSAKLRERLSGLTLCPPQYMQTSKLARQVSGKRYDVKSENEAEKVGFSCTFKDDCTELLYENMSGEHQITCGIGEWVEGATSLFGKPQPVCSSGGWKDENTFVATIRFVETPFYETVTCTFVEDRLKIERVVNVSFGPKEQPVLSGSCN